MKTYLKLFLLLTSLVATSAHARVWTYYAKHVPKDGSTCQDLTAKLAKRVSDSMGLQIYASSFEDSWDFCDLAVTYDGQWSFPVVSTHYDVLPVTLWPKWGTWSYRTEKECLGELPAQLALFQNQTGLRPLYAYCPKWEGIDAEPPVFMLKIDAMGTPRRQPSLYVAPALHDERQEGLDKIISAEITRIGGTIFHYAPSPAEGSAFHFYGDAQSNLGLRSLAFNGYEEKEDCELQLPEANAMVTRYGNTILTSACSTRRPGELSTLYVLFNHNGSTYYELKRHAVEEQYDNLQACIADKPRIEKRYAGLFGWQVMGSLCGTEDIFAGVVSPVLFTLN